jgi:hypothetical protein
MACMKKASTGSRFLLAALDAVDGMGKVLKPHGGLAFLGTAHGSPLGLRRGNGALDAAVAGLLVATVARACYMAVTGWYGLVFPVQQKQCPRGVGRAGWWINVEVAQVLALAFVLDIWAAIQAVILRCSFLRIARCHSASGCRLPSVGCAFARHCRHGR